MSPSIWPILEHHKKLLERETGTIVKEPGGRFKAALIYPNTYTAGMANLGLAVVYRMINQEPDALCERVFLPDRKAQALYRKTGAPLLSLESGRPLAEFDIVLASVSFENDYPNLAAMLESGGLGVWSAERKGPLVIAGGVAPMLNPEPLADIVDGFLLGEAEEALPALLEEAPAACRLGREQALLRLSRTVGGFYAPRFYRPGYHPDGRLASFTAAEGLPSKIKVPKYLGSPSGLAQSAVRAPGPQFGDMALIEVGRGCGHGCRFCAAGHVFRPPRLGEHADFLGPALQAARQGVKVGLVSAAVSDLQGCAALARAVTSEGGSISVSSLRADRLDKELARALAAGGLKSAALAPEAGSPRLRRVINKHLSEDDLARAVEALIAAGVPNLKFYFMVGLEGEEGGDIEELIDLCRRLRQQVVSASKAIGRLGQVTVSLNAFVPKPWTPFQWSPMAPLKTIKARMARVKKALSPLPNLKVNNDVPKYAQLQAAFSRGDRRLGRVIAALGRGEPLARAWKSAGLEPEFYANRRRGADELLPWDFLDHGVSRAYLLGEAKRAAQAKQSPPCDPENCRRCGACGPAQGGG